MATEDIAFDPAELASQLTPTLRTGAESGEGVTDGPALVEDYRRALSGLLPLTDKELAFLDRLLDEGTIDASLLTSDPVLRKRISAQPLLEWKARNFGAVPAEQHGERPVAWRYMAAVTLLRAAVVGLGAEEEVLLQAAN